MTILLKFCGGVGTVTGSMHLLTVDRARVLIDAGLFQGKRDEFYDINSNFPFEPSSITACILSHAHIDHTGNFPTLVKKGFRAKAYATPSTKDLCRYMLPDSGHIQEEDVKYVNKINKRRGLPPRFPLYTVDDAERSLKYFKKLDYHIKTEIASKMNLTFFDAGHILGSSIPVIDIETPKETTRLAYAVDLGRMNLPYLHNPEIPQGINYLIIESTYGGKTHPPVESAEEKFRETINRTVKRGGKIIIPSFALERTQEVLYFLSRLLNKKKIKNIPIYVDSPLAVHVTEVFKDNWEYFDEETQKLFKQNKDPFTNNNLHFITNVEESKQLHDKSGPMIIISASGMCENGRILHHLKNNIENPYNTVIIVGFMAQNTLGRKLVEHLPMVNIFGRPYQLKAEIVVINALSAHADKDFLLNYAAQCNHSLQQVFIVHGEPEQSEALRQEIKKLDVKVTIPRKNEEIFLAGVGK
jgi:metallo-beta-lactamase family protein